MWLALNSAFHYLTKLIEILGKSKMCFYPPLPPDPDEGSKVTLSGFVKLNYCRHFQLNFRQKNKLSGRTAIITYLVLKTYNYCSFLSSALLPLHYKSLLIPVMISVDSSYPCYQNSIS